LLGPTGTGAERFGGTKGADRQILADAAAAGARFLVTEDVDDYGLDDLASVGISAANPDLFLAARLTRDAYSTVIDLFVERQLNPPTTPAQFHAAIAKNHPRLFAAHADLYEVEPEHGIHGEPEVIFAARAACAASRSSPTPPRSSTGSARSAAELQPRGVARRRGRRRHGDERGRRLTPAPSRDPRFGS
jgi:hypothetical protein